jgi:hypothetical protein
MVSNGGSKNIRLLAILYYGAEVRIFNIKNYINSLVENLCY